MSRKLFLTIAGIFAFVNGLGSLLMPATMLAQFGVQTDAAGLLSFQYFGVSTLGIAVAFWLSREKVTREDVRPVLLAGLVIFVLAAILGVISTSAGAMNSLGWVNVVIDVLLALGFGYFLFMDPAD